MPTENKAYVWPYQITFDTCVQLVVEHRRDAAHKLSHRRSAGDEIAWIALCLAILIEKTAPADSAARNRLARAATPVQFTPPGPVTKEVIDTMVAKHEAEAKRHLDAGLDASGSYLLQVAASLAWLQQQAEAECLLPA